MFLFLEKDEIFTTSLRYASEAILVKSGQPWQINLFSGVVHGFAVRAELTNDHQKWVKEQAFCQVIAWFYRYL